MTEKTKAQKVLKIICTVIYVAVTLALIVVLITSHPGDDQGLAKLGFVLSILVYGLIALGVYGISIILGIIGSIIASKRKDKNSFRYFLLMIYLPIITDALFFSTLLFLN